MTHHLGGSGLAGKVDALEVGGAGGVEFGGLRDIRHAIRNDGPILGIDGEFGIARAGKRLQQCLAEVWRKLIGKDDVGADQVSAGGDAADDAGQLQRCGLDRALADGNVEGFVRIPSVMVVLQLPLRGGHEAGLFAGQIDAGLLAEAEGSGVF